MTDQVEAKICAECVDGLRSEIGFIWTGSIPDMASRNSEKLQTLSSGQFISSHSFFHGPLSAYRCGPVRTLLAHADRIRLYGLRTMQKRKARSHLLEFRGARSFNL